MCAAATPRSRDVTDFLFKKLRDLKVGDQKEFENAFNGDELLELLAVSNKYGIVFVGTPKGVHAVFTADIEKDNDDAKKSKLVIEKYSYIDIVIANNISHIALCSDDNVLSVCSLRNGFVFADMYDVPSITKNVFPLTPFSEIKVSSQSSTKLRELKWNPEIPNMFAACLSDKTVSIYEISEGTLKIVGSTPSTINASTISWSPKGKQIVIGKYDGSMAQHLPNLQVAKTIPAPQNASGAVSVVSVSWLSTSQFAVLYKIEGDSCMMLVNVPKSGNPTFINFEDVCYGMSDQRKLYYFMSFLPEWNILICASSLSSDVGVLAMSKTDQTWEQWNVDDRAELPLVGNDCTFPLGMAINLTSQRRTTINEKEISPKPLLHFLSSGGRLCSFCIFNDEAGDKLLVKIPEPIPESKLKQAVQSSVAPNNLSKENLSSQPKSAADNGIKQPTIFTSTPQTNTSWLTNTLGSKPFSSFTTLNATSTQSIMPIPALNLTAARANPATAVITSTTVTIPTSNVPLKPTAISSAVKPVHVNTIISPSFVPNVAPTGNKDQIISPAKAPASDKKATKTQLGLSGSKTPAHTALMFALIEEIGKFNNEVAQVRDRILKSNFEVGSEEERKKLVDETRNLEMFVNVAKDSIKTLNVNIHTLNGCLFDTFATLEEARLLNDRSKDLRYMSLHRNRPLDSIRAKKMQGIRSLFYYLQNQIQEVNLKLDTQLEELDAMQKKSITSILNQPNIQLVCQTLANIRRTIDNLQQRMNLYFGEIERYRSLSATRRELNATKNIAEFKTSFNQTTSLTELAQLSNLMRNVEVSQSGSKLHPKAKTIPPAHLSLLRNALEKRQVAKVLVSVLDDDFSRFISPTAKMRSRINAVELKEVKQELDDRNEPEECEQPVTKRDIVSVKPCELPRLNFESSLSKHVLEAAATHTIISTTNVPKTEFSSGIFAKQEPSFGTVKSTPSMFTSAFQPPSFADSKLTQPLPFGDSKLTQPPPFADSKLSHPPSFGDSKLAIFQSKFSDLITKTPTISSTPTKPVIPVIESVISLASIDRKEVFKVPEESIINPIYEDISPADSPSHLQHFEEHYDEYEPEEDDEEDYEDEENYDDENDVEYEGEGYILTEKEGSENEDEHEHEKFGYKDVTEVQTTSTVASASTTNFKTPPVIANPVTENEKAAPVTSSSFAFSFASSATPTNVSPSSAFALPPTSSEAAVKSVPSSTFSFAAGLTGTAATGITHSFVLPTITRVTSLAPSANTSSFFGKFDVATTAFTTSTETLTSAGTSIFGSSSINNPSFEGVKSSFEQSVIPASTVPSIFGTPEKSAFEGIQTSQAFSFASNISAETPITTITGGFGQSSSVFQTPQQSSSVSPFGQPTSTTSGSLFNQPTTPTTIGSVFGQQTSTTSSGGLFGQPTPTTSSGSLFGQATPTTASGGLFGQQTPTTSSGGMFGQSSGFFSGLGGKASAADANKNAFGSSTFGTPEKSNLFGSKTPATFGTPSAFASGSFSGGVNVGASGSFSSGGSPSVGQTGFGGFQTSPLKTGAFGGSAQFGSAPAFGATPAAFGSMGSHVFGSRSTPATGFGSFAAPSDTPTFGSLASTSPTFNTAQQPQPTSPFGQPSGPGPSFGSLAGNSATGPAPAFGSGQVFGNSGFSSPNKNQFSQWRG